MQIGNLESEGKAVRLQLEQRGETCLINSGAWMTTDQVIAAFAR